MRVVAVAHYGLPHNRGGSEIMLHELLAALVRAGHTAELVVTEHEHPTVTVDGVTVHHGRHHLDRLAAADLLVTHHKEATPAIAAAKQHGIPTALLVHSDLPYNRGYLASGPDLVVFNSHHARQCHRWTGRSLVVNPPVWGHQHATTRGDMVTLINPIPEKGARLFYQLAARMRSTRFLAVEGGYGHERQIRRSLPNVVWQPHTDDMRRHVWARTRILLMPSSYESWGMVGVEAMHSGIPVIAHPTPGLRESLATAGTFIDRRHVSRWITAIRRLWGDHAASDRARQRATELDPTPQLDAWVREVEAL